MTYLRMESGRVALSRYVAAALPLMQYDHVQFPGAVPRSFVGPLLLACVSAPWVALQQYAFGTSSDAQRIVRCVLAMAAGLALMHFARRVLRSAAERAFFLAICAAQFHLTFWAGRTTPNGIAFPLVVASLGEVLGGTRRARSVALGALAVTAVVLRLELLGLAAPAYLWAWLSGRISLARAVAVGLVACMAGVVVTHTIDAYFWHGVDTGLAPLPGGLHWPELVALRFNVWEGRSAAWGVAPPWAYVTHELPKLLSFSLPLVLAGLIAQRRCVFPLLLVATGHVLLLSLLAHKEWRFLVYTVPLWNALAAVGATALMRTWRTVGATLAVLCIVLCAALNALATYVSVHNYPGGAALMALHRRATSPVNVHIDTLAAMTGVSLFLSEFAARPARSLLPSRTTFPWTYDKRESLSLAELCAHTHLLTEEGCDMCGNVFQPLGPPVLGLAGIRRKTLASWTHDILVLPQSTGLDAAWQRLLPVVVEQAPAIWVCGRHDSLLR